MKSADIQTNDPVQKSTRIDFSAQILAENDTALAYMISPHNIEFTATTKEQPVTFLNQGDSLLIFALAGKVPDGMEFKNKKLKLKPGQKKSFDFKWKGNFRDVDSTLTVTYEVIGQQNERFTIPILIKGTNPSPQTPPKAAGHSSADQISPVGKFEVKKANPDSAGKAVKVKP